jgi:hypothetical protein
VNAVAVSAPGSANAGAPFNVTATATLHNNGPASPVNVDTTFDITLPGDCSTGSTDPQTIQDTSAPASTPTTTTAASWSVTCNDPSNHSFTVDASAAIDQVHVSDPTPGNNSGSDQATTQVFGQADVKVNAVAVSAPGSANAGAPFNVTATATLHNNGTISPANVDTTFDITLPGDCSTGSTDPQTVQDTSATASTPTSTAAASWSVTCTNPSNHTFTVDASAAIDQLHVSDPAPGNNSGTDQATTQIFGEADVKVTDVTVTAPDNAAVGVPFDVTVTVTVHNNGPITPVNADTTVTLTLPVDLSTGDPNPITVQDTSLPLSAATVLIPITWSVTCDSAGSHTVTVDASAVIDQLHVSDSTPGNDAGQGQKTIDCGGTTLKIVKDVQPDDPSTNWIIDVTGPTPFSDTFAGDGMTAVIDVLAGTYAITESAGAGTDLADFDSSFSCVGATTNPSGSGTTFQVDIADGENIVCTFVNSSGLGEGGPPAVGGILGLIDDDEPARIDTNADSGASPVPGLLASAIAAGIVVALAGAWHARTRRLA